MLLRQRGDRGIAPAFMYSVPAGGKNKSVLYGNYISPRAECCKPFNELQLQDLCGIRRRGVMPRFRGP